MIKQVKRKTYRLTKKHRIRKFVSRKRYWFSNVKLRTALAIYIAFFMLAALISCSIVIDICSEIEFNILFANTYEADETDAYGNDVTYSYYTLSPPDQFIVETARFIEAAAIPVCFMGCIIIAGMLFYRNRLKKPLAILNLASQKIGENDLDFHIEYERSDEMGALCSSFEKMRGALLESNREMWRQMEERKRLNTAFSHDLRTPLTVLRGYTDLLRKYLPEGKFSQEKVLETATTMSGHIIRLENYVHAMNKLQKLEDIEIKRTVVLCVDFVRTLRESALFILGDKLLHFVSECGVKSLMIDPEIVTQVFENLLANAARYAKSEVFITCRYAVCRHTQNVFSITVRDDGPGFSHNDLALAGNPFYKAKENVYDTHFGLGLNICKTLCARHGGSLYLKNSDAGGAEIFASFLEKK